MSWLRNGGLDRIRLIDDDSYFASLRLRISITDDGFSRRSSEKNNRDKVGKRGGWKGGMNNGGTGIMVR